MSSFPTNARTGQTHKKFGRKYAYSETTGTWAPVVPLASVAEVRKTEATAASATQFYASATDLPLSGNTAGSMAFVQETNRLYLWSGTGWYNVATISPSSGYISGADSGYTLATDGTPTVITLSQTGLTSPTWSYQVTSGSIGRTATVTQSDNVFTITPSTNPKNVGSFNITFSATDGSNTILRSSAFTLSNTAPVITADPSASYSLANDGTPTIVTLAATDAEGHPITWSYQVISGSLGDTTISSEGSVFTVTPGTSNTTFNVKFIASDSVLTDETPLAEFVLEFVAQDQYYNQTTLLLKTLEPGTSRDIIDNGPSSISIGSLGASGSIGSYPFISGDSPYSPTHYSAYGEASFSYNDNLFKLGTGNFTIECWIFGNGENAGQFLNIGGMQIRLLEASYSGYGKAEVYYNGSFVGIETVAGDPNQYPTSYFRNGQWSHIALVRNSGILTLYKNGLYQSSASFTTNGTLTTANIGTNIPVCDVRFVKSAVYTSNFTPPTEPLTVIPNTVFLTFSQNNSAKFFRDASDNKLIPDIVGFTGGRAATKIPFAPTTTPTKYDPAIHGGSIFIPYVNNGPRIFSNTNTAVGPGTSDDFTLECWVNRKQEFSSSGTGTQIIGFTGVGGSGSFDIYYRYNRYYFSGTSSGNTITETLGPTYHVDRNSVYFRNFWDHLAVVRYNGTTTFYINGIAGGTTTASYGFDTVSSFRMGRWPDASPYASCGMSITDVRYVKGTSVYTSNFEPPTGKLTSISGTQLLLNFDNPKVFSELVHPLGGDVTISDAVTKYSPTSLYFDGNQVLYLASAKTSTNVNVARRDFTVEGWVHPTSSLTTLQYLLGSDQDYDLEIKIENNNLVYNNNGTTALKSLSGVTLNSWFHFAVTKNNGVVRVFVNGVSGTPVTINTDAGGRSAIGHTAIGGKFAETVNLVNASGRFTGYMEDFRITHGYARYITDFTPPTAALGFTNAE